MTPKTITPNDNVPDCRQSLTGNRIARHWSANSGPNALPCHRLTAIAIVQSNRRRRGSPPTAQSGRGNRSIPASSQSLNPHSDYPNRQRSTARDFVPWRFSDAGNITPRLSDARQASDKPAQHRT